MLLAIKITFSLFGAGLPVHGCVKIILKTVFFFNFSLTLSSTIFSILSIISGLGFYKERLKGGSLLVAVLRFLNLESFTIKNDSVESFPFF